MLNALAFSTGRGLAVPPLRARRVPGHQIAILVAALVLLLAQGWSPHLVDEPVAQSVSARHTPIDAEIAVEQARRAVVPFRAGPDGLVVEGGTYRASFDQRGFTYTPSAGSTRLRVDLLTVGSAGTTRQTAATVWEPSHQAAQRRVGAGVTERVSARHGELEWDIVLSRPLEPSGDVLVRARVDGVAAHPSAVEPETDGRALRLRLTDGTTVRLGALVVVDATGRELYRGLPHVEQGVIELSVPASALRGAVFPVTLDPTVGPATTVTAAGNRYQPSVAFDGTNFLVVWQELVGSQYEIYGTRIDGDGTTVGTPFLISAGSTAVNDVGPDVAWDGSSYLVVWEQQLQATNADILGRRVSTAGAPIGGTVLISTPVSVQRAPAVAGNTVNGGFYVVWHDCRVSGNCDIFGGRVSGTGTVLDGSGVQVSISAKNEFVPDVAFNGTKYLVVWEYQFNGSDDDVYSSLVTAAGLPQGGGSIVANPSARQRDPAVASDGSGWFVVWEDNQSGANDIYGSLINSSGNPPDFTGSPICTVADDQSDAAIAFNGVYLAVWRDRRNGTNGDVLASRIATNGSVTDPNGYVITNTTADEDTPAVSRASSGWAVDYERGPVGTTSIVQRAASK